VSAALPVESYIVFTTPSPRCTELLQPNLHETQQYFHALGASTSAICFQIFDDQGRNRRLAQTLHGSLDNLAPKLTQLNQQGAGIFTPVNEIAAGKPRTTENVVRVRALFADADDPDRLPEVEAAIARFGLAPSIIVETSPGKRHFYWLTNDCPLAAFTGAQRALAAQLGSDPAVSDLPRVARVPGFLHRKGAPFLVRLVTP
jgi:RepB DNA-primase from phage plasmid